MLIRDNCLIQPNNMLHMYVSAKKNYGMRIYANHSRMVSRVRGKIGSESLTLAAKSGMCDTCVTWSSASTCCTKKRDKKQ